MILRTFTRNAIVFANIVGGYARPQIQPAASPVDSAALQAKITTDGLLAHTNTLQAIAYNTTQRNRLIGTPGHEGTIQYIVGQLNDPALGGYYNVSLQSYIVTAQQNGTASLVINGANQSLVVAEYSPSTDGTVNAPLVVVANLGCNATDYPSEVLGAIALIERGTCSFNEKSSQAGAAGAVGAVIYNNIAGPITGITLSPDTLSVGPRVPTVAISREQGLTLRDSIAPGNAVVGDLFVKTVIKEVTTQNVIAQTNGGDPENVLFLGAHTDSVAAGPGINDNGSGTSGILEVARQLAVFTTTNAVRFGFWSAEEEGLLGSKYYVATLPEEERAKVRLYLNFDMIASPNYVYGIYDGDGDAFNATVTIPPGSASIEEMFQDYFTSVSINYTAAEFSGRSDYGPFIAVGIASGGLFTGAEGVKTAEQAAQVGGTAGVSYDSFYHKAGDTTDNLNPTAFTANAKAIAHAVAVYGSSFESVDFSPAVGKKLKRRNGVRSSKMSLPAGHGHACSGATS